MTTAQSVVTPERYATGIGSFQEWMGVITQRQAEFQRHYDEYTPKPEDVEFFKQQVAARGVKALVMGEDWCPDVWRGLPTIAKLGEQSGDQTLMARNNPGEDDDAKKKKNGNRLLDTAQEMYGKRN